MAEASQACIDIAELQARASAMIADATGAEAGYVTSGAAAGLLLGTAACVTGLDPGKMNRLPDTTGMKNEYRDGAQSAQLPRPRRARCRRADHRGRDLGSFAAAQLPPAENLKRFIGEGADLVVFSGGKAIRVCCCRRP